jgi:lactoylglutathione lyase
MDRRSEVREAASDRRSRRAPDAPGSGRISRSGERYADRMGFIHTCYRVLELDRSIAFYEALGFAEVRRVPIREEAVNVFMNIPGDGDVARLELTFNVGREEPYEIGTGYGHIAISSPDLDAALERLAAQGIEPEKPPYRVREGGSRLCFVRDPDGYRIELIERAESA